MFYFVVVVLLFFFLAQEKEQELEQLTKELRQVNLQQFIQQTGTKVTVLPALPTGENNNGTYTNTHTHIYINPSTHQQRLHDLPHYHHLVIKFNFMANLILAEPLYTNVFKCVWTQCPLVVDLRIAG